MIIFFLQSKAIVALPIPKDAQKREGGLDIMMHPFYVLEPTLNPILETHPLVESILTHSNVLVPEITADQVQSNSLKLLNTFNRYETFQIHLK